MFKILHLLKLSTAIDFTGASGAYPRPFAPAKFLDHAPGGAFAPRKFLDTAPGGAFAPTKFFDPAAGGAKPRRGETTPGAEPCWCLPRAPEFLAKNFTRRKLSYRFVVGLRQTQAIIVSMTLLSSSSYYI